MTKSATAQKPGTEPETAPISIRMPETGDGKDIYALVKESGTLDVNSEYAYLLLGTHFQQSCAAAKVDGRLAGFVSAYIPPNQPDVLFVWQVAVDGEYRKRGLALAMLKDILCRPCCAQTKYIQATITPSNFASRSLFTSLARDLDTSFHERFMFPEEYFSESHEPEPLFVIGPLLHQPEEEIT